MANMVQEVWLKAVDFAMRLRGAVALLFSRAMVRALWCPDRGPTPSAGRPPTVWQQLLHTAVQLRGHTRQDVLEVGPRVVPMHLGRLQQAHHDGSALAGQLTAHQEPPSQSRGCASLLKRCRQADT